MSAIGQLHSGTFAFVSKLSAVAYGSPHFPRCSQTSSMEMRQPIQYVDDAT